MAAVDPVCLETYCGYEMYTISDNTPLAHYTIAELFHGLKACSYRESLWLSSCELMINSKISAYRADLIVHGALTSSQMM